MTNKQKIRNIKTRQHIIKKHNKIEQQTDKIKNRTNSNIKYNNYKNGNL